LPPNPSNSPAPGLLLRLTTVPEPRVSAGQPYPLVFRLGLPGPRLPGVPFSLRSPDY
jgi:hypothetical protein